jgi:mRNA-degrading endonuclease RelE of RelBE toxin-antitoxin system
VGHRVIVNSKTRRDLRRISAGPEARRILDKLVELGRDEQNLDVKALQGARPWLRVGDYRVLYALAPGDVYEIERIVHRRDLDSAAAGSASSSGNSPMRRFSRGAPAADLA